MIDLHLHTKYSDGTDDIGELINKLEANKVKYFSITDHDNITSFYKIKNNLDLLKDKQMQYISGIEISSDFEGQSMHILVYNYDTNIPAITSILDEIHHLRIERIKAHIENLKNSFQIELDNKELLWLFSHTNPSKPHLANILIKKGYGTDVSSVIKKYLHSRFSHLKLDAKQIVSQLSKHKLIVGIAHPLGGVGEPRISKEQLEHNVTTLKECGIKFLECYYSLYNKEDRETIVKIAKKNSLKLSGGSDYHGKNKTVEIGNLGNDYKFNKSDFTILNLIN
ncbi:MAG: PHP domain-containing protein [Clostridiales bacterium]|nr:PHP domain-containing protein [Clostridiales bacterium]